MMRHGRRCGCDDGDGSHSTHELLLSSTDSQRVACSAGSLSSSRSRGARRPRAELEEETLWLAQQLAIADAQTRYLQESVRQLRRRVKAMATQHASEKTQWQRDMEQRQQKWADEYERHTQSLLQIITHHEAKQAAMQREIDELREQKDARKSVGVGKEQATQTGGGQCASKRDDGPLSASSIDKGGCHHHCDASTRCTEQDNNDSVADESPQRGDTLVVPVVEETHSIHEQYVALTMQKLLEQLRLANHRSIPSECPASGSSCASMDTTASIPPSSPFRESIYKRLSTNSSSAVEQYLRATSGSQSSLRSVALSPVNEESDGSRNRDPMQRWSQPAA